MTEQERWAWRVDENTSGDVSFFPIPDTVDAPDPPSDGDVLVPESRALTAESRVQELEGEREASSRLLTEALQEAALERDEALNRAEAAESHLARLEEAAMKVRERADYLRYVWDNGAPGKEELEAIVRSIAEVVAEFDVIRTPPRSDG